MRLRPSLVRRTLTTVLFTDIVASTERATLVGDRRFAELIERHHRIVRQQLKRHGGREVDTAGDGFFIAFTQPDHAIACALNVAMAVQALGIQIRAGIHVGETERLGRRVGGIAVHLGARVLSAAQPGQVVVTSTVRELARGSQFEFEDLGMHGLKGIPDPVRLYAARIRADVPVMTTGSSPRHLLGSLRNSALVFLGALITVGALVLAAIVVADPTGDGAEGDPGVANLASGRPSSTGVTTRPAESPSGTPGVVTLDLTSAGSSGAIELPEGEYAFRHLRPRVTFAVEDVGWYAYVDDVDAGGLLLDNPSSPPGLDLVGGVAFGFVQLVFDDPCNVADPVLLDTAPNALIEWLRAHALLTTSGARPVNIGGYSGLEVDVSLSAPGCRGATQLDLFPVAETRFHVDAGDRLRVIVVNLPSRPLAILVQLSPDADENVAATIERLLASLEIDPT